jgi:hypothetical protein
MDLKSFSSPLATTWGLWIIKHAVGAIEIPPGQAAIIIMLAIDAAIPSTWAVTVAPLVRS